MKLRTLLLGIAVFGLGLSDANATPTNDTATLLGGPLKVKQIVLGNTTISQVEFTNSAGTTISCGSGTLFSISKSHPSHDLMVKGLLASYLSGRALGYIGYENISGTCWYKGGSNQ